MIILVKMAIIKSEQHLTLIERRNTTKKNNIFNNEGFMSIEQKQNLGLIPTDRLGDYQHPISLDDRKNKSLFDFKYELLDYASYKKWYDRIDVQFEIIKFLLNREFALLIPSWIENKELKRRSIRMMKCHNLQGFQFIMNKGLKVFDRKTPYNLYYSLAKYTNGIPNQTFNLSERDNSAWHARQHEEMMGYDFLIDIDAGSHEDLTFAQETAINISESFNSFNVPHEIRFSGMGFHLIIPSEYLPTHSFLPDAEYNRYKYLASIAKILNKTYSEMIDLNIYDSRRICKIPYSLALYEKDIYICCPMKSLNELKSFKLENYQLNNFNQEIKGRGTTLFNKEGDFNNLLDVLK